MWLHRIKGSFYSLFFILLNLVYLVIELSFNARVLDVSANMSPTTDFGQLEVYGRSLSASGATLLAWRLLVPFESSLNLFRLALKFFTIAIIVFPVVFIAQKKLVDDLVNLSSSETRRSAEILSLLKYGIANGFVEIDELSLDDLTLQTAEGKMFINLSGLLAYNSSHMREVLEVNLDKIAAYAIATQKSSDTREQYKNYRYAREQVVQQFNHYQRLVHQLEEKRSASRAVAISMYESAMNNALLPWLEYQQTYLSSQSFKKVPDEVIVEIHALLESYQQEINACTSELCVDEGVRDLELLLSKALGFHSVLSSWCQQQPFDLQQGTNLDCQSDRDELKGVFIDLHKTSLAVHAGLSRWYRSKLDYLKSQDMRARVFSHFQDEGIQPDTSWEFGEYERVLSDIVDQLDALYLQQYNHRIMSQFTENIKPRTELNEFNALKMMQSYYENVLGDQQDVVVAINLSQQQLEDRYVAPLYTVKLNALVNKLHASEEWYQSDAPYEQSGKNSLRNLVVPLVAIALSLIFGLLNLLNLLLNFVFLIIEERLWLRWVGTLLLSTLILMLPIQQEYKIYSQAPYQDLLSETENNYNEWAYGLDWVAKTEPLVYPLGNILRYNFLYGFKFD